MSKETGCTGKKFWYTYESAKAAAKRRNRSEKFSKYLRTYKCEYCACWHHSTKPKQSDNVIGDK